MKIKSKVSLQDYRESLENYLSALDRNYYDMCKEFSKDIKRKWYFNFSDFLKTIHLNEEGIFDLLYPYSKNINEFSFKIAFRLEMRYDSILQIKNHLDSLKLIKDDYIYVDFEMINLINEYKTIKDKE